jgi:hypothetical protein
MRVGELVDAMALPQSTMSHQLKRLQTRRLIRRRRSRRDNRSVAVMLTPAGEEIARACEHYSVAVQRRVIESFSTEQIDQLTKLLNSLFDVLEVSHFSPRQAVPEPLLVRATSRHRRKQGRTAQGKRAPAATLVSDF